MMKTDLSDLLIEVETKRAELCGATTQDVLRDLMRDAASAYWRPSFAMLAGAMFNAYPFRVFARRSDQSVFDFCERLLVSIERGGDTVANVADLAADFRSRSKPAELPTPNEARRLRVVTAIMPVLIPSSDRGVAGSPATAWRIIWLSACGLKAPQIAQGLRRSDGDPIKRNQVFRLRDKLYDAIAAKVDDALLTRAAA